MQRLFQQCACDDFAGRYYVHADTIYDLLFPLLGEAQAGKTPQRFIIRQEIVQQIRCAGQVCRDRETLASLLLGLLGQRQKNRCLVAIEVCLQETTGQRV